MNQVSGISEWRPLTPCHCSTHPSLLAAGHFHAPALPASSRFLKGALASSPPASASPLPPLVCHPPTSWPILSYQHLRVRMMTTSTWKALLGDKNCSSLQKNMTSEAGPSPAANLLPGTSRGGSGTFPTAPKDHFSDLMFPLSLPFTHPPAPGAP